MGRTASVSKKVELVEESPFEEIQRLYSVISKRVVGQEDAKRVVAMAVALHLDRVKNNSESAKSNVLLYGPTGSGKTEIARAIVNDLKCAFLIVDCSKLTPSGFVGEDPSSFLLELFEKSGDDLEKTQQGIVFLDEIDKLCVANYSHEGAFQSRKVMAELLKIIEGQKIQFKRKSFVPGMDNNLTIDTKNILFIAAGAFAGIEEHYASSDSEKVISFSVKAPVKVSSQPAQGEFVKALFKFGMMPELAGRFQLMSSTKKLGKEDYIGLIENKSFSHTTNYYAQLLAKENVTLTLSQELISELADQAIQLGLGVRGIQGLVETRMVDLVFDIEALRGKTVTLDCVGHTASGFESKKKKTIDAFKIMKTNSILSGLDKMSLVYFCEAGKTTTLPAGAVAMTEGEAPNSILILLEGSLRATNQLGLDVIRDEVGTCFGEISFLQGRKRTATVTAAVESKVLELTHAELRSLINTRPDLGVKILQSFSKVAFERIKV